MRWVLAAGVALILNPVSGLANPEIVVGDTRYQTLGKRISLSSVVRLARFSDNGFKLSNARAYLPAGQILLVGKGPLCQRQTGKTWCLSVTQNGLPVYVVVKQTGRGGFGYFKVDGYSDVLAVALRGGTIRAEDGTEFNYTPSEKFQFLENEQGEAVLSVLHGSRPDVPAGYQVNISEHLSDFAIVDTEEVRSDADFYPTRPLRGRDVYAQLAEDVANFELTSDTLTGLKQRFEGLLISSKSCEQTREIKTGIGGEITGDIGGFWSAVDAKFKLTASFSNSTEYPAGVDIEARRYVQGSPDGSVRYFEIWERSTHKDKTCAGVVQTRITGIDDNTNEGLKGEITSGSAHQIGLGVSPTGKFPTYSCAREYLQAFDHLTSTDGQLSHEAAAMMVTYALRYDGGKSGGIKTCKVRPQPGTPGEAQS